MQSKVVNNGLARLVPITTWLRSIAQLMFYAFTHLEPLTRKMIDTSCLQLAAKRSKMSFNMIIEQLPLAAESNKSMIPVNTCCYRTCEWHADSFLTCCHNCHSHKFFHLGLLQISVWTGQFATRECFVFTVNHGVLYQYSPSLPKATSPIRDPQTNIIEISLFIFQKEKLCASGS